MLENVSPRARPDAEIAVTMQGFGEKAELGVDCSERLQFLAGLEAHRFAGRDADFLAGARIAADAGLARAHVEYTEAAQLNSLALAERVLHGFKDGFDGLFGLGPAHAGLVYNGIYNVQLNHTSLLLFNGKLCYACSCGLSSWTRSDKMRVFARSCRRPWMSVKPDRWIRKMALEHKMIEPFEDRQVREGVISYGVSSYGYDIRVADEFRIFTNVNSTIVDPKHFDSRSLVEFKGAECLVPPNSFALGRSVEYFRIPRNVLTICLGKSTYARCGIIVNVTPFEPEWEGFVTLEISNTTPLPAKIYANEGLCQVLFFESDEECEISYKDKKGKYQAQQGIVLPRL
jgi:dCTP deaminase